MGWLKTHFDGSFNDLARQMKQSASWPEGFNLQDRALGNVLRELDGGQKMDYWWHRGAALRPVLAEVLGLPLTELDTQIRGGGSPGCVPFPCFPALRPFDPNEDAPPPGLPAVLVDPLARLHRDGARRLWWKAGYLERALLREWSRRHLGFRVVAADQWARAVDLLPSQGRVWVDLDLPGGPDPRDTPLPEALRLVVAAPFSMTGVDLLSPELADHPFFHRGYEGFLKAGLSPRTRARHDALTARSRLPSFQARAQRLRPEEREEGGSYTADLTTWKEVPMERPSLWLPELLDWVEDRVGRLPGWSRARVEDLLGQPWLAPWLTSPGSVLEVLGLLMAASRVRKLGASDLARAWIRERVAHSSDDALGSFLPRVPHVVTAAVRGRLHRGHGPHLAPGVWRDLLDLEGTWPDPTRALDLLEAGQVEEAKRVLRIPFPERVFDILARAQVLVPCAMDAWDLAEPWVANALVQEATASALQGPPSDWGALLLSPESSLQVFRALYERALAGDMAFAEDGIRSFDLDRLETVAATVGAMLALGLALVRVEVSADLAARLLACLKGARSPWTGLLFPLVHPDLRVQELSMQSHRIAEACLVLAAGGMPDPDLLAGVTHRDWEGDGSSTVDMEEALWVLGARLEARWHGSPLPYICQASRLARLLATNPDDPQADALLKLPFPVKGLMVAIRVGSFDVGQVLQAAWRRWAAEPDPLPFAWLVKHPKQGGGRMGGVDEAHPRRSEIQDLWHFLPPDLASGGLGDRMTGALADVAPYLSPAVWEAWIRPRWARWCDLPASTWDFLPEPLLGELAAGLPLQTPVSDAVRTSLQAMAEALWRRIPDQARSHMAAHLVPGTADPLKAVALHLVVQAPWPEVLAGFEAWTAGPLDRIGRQILLGRLQAAMEQFEADPRVVWPMMRRLYTESG